MRPAVLAALLVLAAMVPTFGAAQVAAVPAILGGSFVARSSASEGRARVLAALEPQIALLPYFVQGLVRDRIEERLGIPRRITVAVPADPAGDIRVTYEGERTVTIAAPVGGSTTVTSAEGRAVPVSHRLSAGWLEQLFQGEHGTLTVLLSTEPDGRTLHADGTMRGERLGAPVGVRLDYVRE
jgi:hypothetical protein